MVSKSKLFSFSFFFFVFLTSSWIVRHFCLPSVNVEQKSLSCDLTATFFFVVVVDVVLCPSLARLSHLKEQTVTRGRTHYELIGHRGFAD